MALIVKSRRWRSSRIDACSTVGSAAGAVVELGAGGDDVDALPVAVEHDGGAELLVRAHAAAELLRDRPRQRDCVALDGDVHVEAVLAEQDVPDGPADEVDAVDRVARGGDGVEHRREPLQAPQLVGDRLARLGRRLRASPSACRTSLLVTTPASRSPCSTATRPSAEAVSSRCSSGRLGSSSTVGTRPDMIPFTGACERPWPIALSRSSRRTDPTRRPSSVTRMPLCP